MKKNKKKLYGKLKHIFFLFLKNAKQKFAQGIQGLKN